MAHDIVGINSIIRVEKMKIIDSIRRNLGNSRSTSPRGRVTLLVCLLALVLQPLLYAANSDHTTDRLLRAVVPGADHFADKEGEPPVYKAYKTDDATGESSLIGYAFVTPDFPPEPNGYSGPIDVLIGMDLQGTIVGLRVIYYKESFRYTMGDFFSWGFEEQFPGKTAADRYSIGRDIDGVARATISSKAAARSIRKAVRAVTEAYIK